jgi:CheY-like chemotaxis protein
MASLQNVDVQSPTKRVLVVEDNLDTVHSMALLIKMMGHEVQFAINGFAAMDIARAFRPHVILVDIALPDFSGFELARQLRWEPGLEDTRIVALTGLPADEDFRRRALDAGCLELYAKPLEPAKLEALLNDSAAPGSSTASRSLGG